MSFEEELADFRRVLGSVSVVGQMSRDQELIALAQLIERYPAEAREMLAHRDEAT